MRFEDFVEHLRETRHDAEECDGADKKRYVVIRGVAITAGRNAGKTCDVAILRTEGEPWVPQPAIHVRPHLVPMGQFNSQKSAFGPEWQYLSRRFDRVPTPKGFLAHVLTVLGEH